MTRHAVGFIGTGTDPDDPGGSGFAMAYHHAAAYERLDGCELVACADIERENAEAFADPHGIDADYVYEDYRTMLSEALPDVVSVCTPPATHEEIVVDCARSGEVDAIHCEKPMAVTWGGARRMARVCREEGVQLTFNHQRRFAVAWRRARELLDEGAIGDLERVEMGAPNLYDWGTHSLDLLNFYNDEVAAEWVLAGLDYREENRWFGAHNANQVVTHVRYENGVHGLFATGPGEEMVGARHRLRGSDGTIEVGVLDGPGLRVRRDGGESETAEFDEHWTDPIDKAVEDLVDALDAGRAPELGAERALAATEVIFAAFESVRRDARVDLPLEVDDNPLAAMVESGRLSPAPTE